MHYSNTDIKPKKVMYVNFEPIKPNEFGGKHLAVILVYDTLKVVHY